MGADRDHGARPAPSRLTSAMLNAAVFALAISCWASAATPPAVASGAIATAARAEDRVAYPIGYSRWTHIRSGLITAKHPAFARFGGLHHIYANPASLEGYRSGRYADGSVLVYDLFETRDHGDGIVDQGPRRQIDVMVKDSKRFAATGGWGYAEFAAGTTTDRLNNTDRDGCAACHASRKQHGHVFSEWPNRVEPQAGES
ncbi:cytochrome P460 family protein [Lysobacter capsici]|uniref:cytochrome P460 family protein n=1 Tax=Lysobacter capsici TaxID=435897 RepID=UPI000BBAB5E5|nr:cytochrome P460 family protein [Lysobacter capsici]ATE73092.1 cytochrome C [Lysobacter capsici]